MTDERLLRRDRLVTAAKLVVGVALLAWVLSSVEWSELRAQLATLDALVIGALLLVTAGEFGTRFAMWHALLRRVGEPSFATAARVDLSVKFVNHVVPSKAAGHAVAPLVLKHFTEIEWSDAVGLAGGNTALYSLLYGVASLIGLVVFWLALPAWLALGIAGSTALYVVAAGAILLTGHSSADGNLGARLAARLPFVPDVVRRTADALPSIAADAKQTFRSVVQSPRTVGLYALAWAGTLVVAPGIRVWLLLSAFGSGFEPVVLLPICLITAYSVTVLPITPGGVGVAEFSAVYVFVALGVPEAAIVPAILVDRFLGVYLAALLGWLPLMDVDVHGLLEAESPLRDGG